MSLAQMAAPHFCTWSQMSQMSLTDRVTRDKE
jgi:hypothetical protein